MLIISVNTVTSQVLHIYCPSLKHKLQENSIVKCVDDANIICHEAADYS